MRKPTFKFPDLSIAHHVLPAKGKARWVAQQAGGGMVVVCLLLAGPARAAEFPDLRFSAGRLEVGDYSLAAVEARLDRAGNFEFQAGGLGAAKSGFSLGEIVFGGMLHEVSTQDGGLRASGLARYQSLAADWNLAVSEENASLCLSTAAQSVESLAGNLRTEMPLNWVKEGAVETCVRYAQPDSAEASVDIDFIVTGLSFDSPDGLYAGEGLALEFHGELLLAEQPAVAAGGTIKGGQVLLDAFYTDFSSAPLQFSFTPEITNGALAGADLEAWDDGAFRAEAEWEVATEEKEWMIRIGHLELKFPDAYGRYIEPVAAAWTLDGLEVTGSVMWSGSISASGLHSGDLDIVDLSVVDTARGRFALTGLDTRLRPGDYSFDSAFNWRGLLLGKINLGPGSASLDSEPGAFALASPLELGVLGGQLRFDRLRYVMPGSPAAASGVSRFELASRLDNVDMDRLTVALGWPRFSGRLGGEVPDVRLENGVLSADGEVRVSVFGGEVVISDLEAERLFGVLPSLSANVALTDLDLEQLTETFQFGRIGGRVDGRVSGLRLLDWQPVAFDAWIGTPARQGKSKSISRQAVSNLTTIGGGGATAALTSPFMRLFSSFSYRRLGIGCLLQNYVCDISGISEDGESVLLLEGAGIPKITVRAWNRRVDWPQMVANLLAIGGGGEIKVGDAPEP